MNRQNNVKHVKSSRIAPRVLRFVGYEDMRISLGRWVAVADRAFYCGLPYRDAMQREQALRRTLATDKERVCEVK